MDTKQTIYIILSVLMAIIFIVIILVLIWHFFRSLFSKLSVQAPSVENLNAISSISTQGILEKGYSFSTLVLNIFVFSVFLLPLNIWVVFFTSIEAHSDISRWGFFISLILAIPTGLYTMINGMNNPDHNRIKATLILGGCYLLFLIFYMSTVGLVASF